MDRTKLEEMHTQPCVPLDKSADYVTGNKEYLSSVSLFERYFQFCGMLLPTIGLNNFRIGTDGVQVN